MMPFWFSNGGGLQEIEMVVESTASPEILAGAEVGAMETKRDQNSIKMRVQKMCVALSASLVKIDKFLPSSPSLTDIALLYGPRATVVAATMLVYM